MEKRLFRMSEKEFEALMDISRNKMPVIYVGVWLGLDSQERANKLWQIMADKYGFIWETASAAGSDKRSFYAEPRPGSDNKIEAGDIIGLVRRLPDADKHITLTDGKWQITDEWLVGNFAGMSFEGDTIEEATEQMMEYFLTNMNGRRSMVRDALVESGYPNLVKVEAYCLKEVAHEK